MLRGIRNKQKAVVQLEQQKTQEKEKEPLNKDKAATILQCLVRMYLARIKIRRVAKGVWIRVFDPTYKRYFWYDRLHGASSWKQPKYVELFDNEDIQEVINIQRVVRGFLGRCRTKALANQKYVRYFDSESNRFYWFDKESQKTYYVVSKWLQNQHIAMPKEDQLLLQSNLKIKELEKKLLEKDNEIKKIRLKRYEELEPEIIRDKVKNAKNLRRSKHMDDWTTDDLAAWFTQLKMEEYIPSLFSNRVDGALFVNLSDDEFHDLGITNRFHIRKLQLIMKGYRTRYERRKDRKQQHDPETEDEDDLISEYAPSELSALIAAENEDDSTVEDDYSEENDSLASDENELTKLTEEQELQKRMDSQNITVQLLMKGDGENFPIIGDIVRVKYTCSISDGKVIMSTKNVLNKPWVEFVLGIEQVVKGFDRGLTLMSVGERSKITVSPEYGYGKTGLPPHIPPNTALVFDVTLLGFRPRTNWVKPLIQDPRTHERPYFKDLVTSLQLAKRSDMINDIGHIFSSSMILNDDDNVLAVKSALESTGAFQSGSKM